jgi:hypothetical protein
VIDFKQPHLIKADEMSRRATNYARRFSRKRADLPVRPRRK